MRDFKAEPSVPSSRRSIISAYSRCMTPLDRRSGLDCWVDKVRGDGMTERFFCSMNSCLVSDRKLVAQLALPYPFGQNCEDAFPKPFANGKDGIIGGIIGIILVNGFELGAGSWRLISPSFFSMSFLSSGFLSSLLARITLRMTLVTSVSDNLNTSGKTTK